MDAKTFARLEKKIDEFVNESAIDELKFCYGHHLAEIVAKAAAVVMDGMEYTSHLANDVPMLPDTREEYETAEEFILDARRSQADEQRARLEEVEAA